MIAAITFLVMVVFVIGGCDYGGYSDGGYSGVHGNCILKFKVGIE